MFESWFRRPRAARLVPRRAPRLETLEDRTLLAGDVLVANDDAAQLATNAPTTSIDVTANDTFNGRSLQAAVQPGFSFDSVGVRNQGEAGTQATAGLLQPAHGHVTASGVTVSYTPDSTFVDQDRFQYVVLLTVAIDPGNNNFEKLMATATVTVTRPAGGIAAGGLVAGADTAQTTINQPVTIDYLLANDSDSNGLGFSVVATSDGTQGGKVTLNPGGAVTYVPPANFVGADTFTYTIQNTDNSTATATVTVQVLAQNSTPVAVTDFAVTTVGQPVTIPVLANDSDPAGGTLRVTSVSTATDGTAVLNADGTVTYTPNFGFTGVNVFTYRVQNAQGGSADGVVSVAVGLSQDAAFVASAYARLLGRAPDPQGDQSAIEDIQILDQILEQQLDDADAAREKAYRAVLEGIEKSPEYHQKQVTQAYQDLLGRDPDPSGNANFLARLEQPGVTIEDVRADILSSPEYRGKHPNYVADLYQAVLKRAVDPAGLKFFNDLLANGANPRDVVTLIQHSDEAVRLGVTGAYQKILGRQPDASGALYYFNKLQDAGNKAAKGAKNAQLAVRAAEEARKAGLLTVEEEIALSKEALAKLSPSK
jgi:hypothetical protein